MRRWRRLVTVLPLLWLCACKSPPPAPAAPRPGEDAEPPTKGFTIDNRIHDSVYAAVDRSDPAPPGYGLYTVLLARSPDAVSTRVLSTLFTRIVGARESAEKRVNLNLIAIPVKKSGEADRLLDQAHDQPDKVAGDLLRQHYDFGEAAALMRQACQAPGGGVAKACGSPLPDGPLLVTGLRAMSATRPVDQRLLIVNLSRTPPQAVPEIIAAYRRQILREDYTGPGDLNTWRLWMLDHVLDAANLLPLIRKAYSTEAGAA